MDRDDEYSPNPPMIKTAMRPSTLAELIAWHRYQGTLNWLFKELVREEDQSAVDRFYQGPDRGRER